MPVDGLAVPRPIGSGCLCLSAGDLYRANIMKYEKLFPTMLILMDLCAALGYVPCGDWRKVVYWVAAAILTFCVTY